MLPWQVGLLLPKWLYPLHGWHCNIQDYTFKEITAHLMFAFHTSNIWVPCNRTFSCITFQTCWCIRLDPNLKQCLDFIFDWVILGKHRCHSCLAVMHTKFLIVKSQANKFCGERWRASTNMSTLSWVSKKSEKHLTSGSQSLYLSLTVQNPSLANTEWSLMPLSHRVYQMGGRTVATHQISVLWDSTDFNLSPQLISPSSFLSLFWRRRVSPTARD